MSKHRIDHLTREISGKIKKPRKKTIFYYLILILSPSILLIDETGKDKSGIILTTALAFILLVTLVLLISTGKISGFCLIGYVAVNIWGWLLHGMGREEQD